MKMKTRTLFTAFLALITAALFTSCEKINGKGETITETRQTGTFNSIGLSMSATVYFTQGPDYSVQVMAQENIIGKIETETDGDKLIVRIKKNVILGHHDPIKIYITAPDIKGLDISASGEIKNQGPLTTGNLELNISGSGSINAGIIYCSSVEATISGSGDIKADGGTATGENLRISGSGSIDLRNVSAEQVEATTSGSGDTYLNAGKSLDVTISGSGDIWYSGSPSMNIHISGSGSIQKL